MKRTVLSIALSACLTVSAAQQKQLPEPKGSTTVSVTNFRAGLVKVVYKEPLDHERGFNNWTDHLDTTIEILPQETKEFDVRMPEKIGPQILVRISDFQEPMVIALERKTSQQFRIEDSTVISKVDERTGKKEPVSSVRIYNK